MKNILVLTDFSENARKAENYALQLAIHMKADLVLYNAYSRQATPGSQNVVWPHDPPASLQSQSIHKLASGMTKFTAKLSKLKEHSHKPAIRFLANEGSISHNLEEVILQNKIWMIVMGTKGEGFVNNLLFGSNVYKVLDKATCPVLVIPPNAKYKELEKIVYATDFKSFDLNVVEWLDSFTKHLKLKQMIAHVTPGILPAEADENLKKLTQKIYQTKIPNSFIVSFRGNNIAHALHEIVLQTGANMFVLLHRKPGIFEKFVHSSTSHKMIKNTGIPVLIFADNP